MRVLSTKLQFLSLISLCLNTHHVDAFAPSSTNIIGLTSFNSNEVNGFSSVSIRLTFNQNKRSFNQLQLASNDNDQEKNGFLSNLKINPPYALAYFFFISLAAYMNSVEPVGASQAIIEKFIEDPTLPGVNELFVSEFNLLGLIGLPMACLVMPGSKGQSLPAPPFLFLSSLAGYGSLGIYMSTRKTPDVNDNLELGFVTRNILENKIFNWLVVALVSSTFIVSGAIPALLNDSQSLFAGYFDTITSSALGFVSTVDLTILCLTAASLIPEDLERRGVTDGNKAIAIAASTLLLPGLGASLYCALRPNLSEE